MIQQCCIIFSKQGAGSAPCFEKTDGHKQRKREETQQE
jgi:hypothetical protein